MKKIKSFLHLETKGIYYALIMTTLGALLYAIGVNSIVIPNKFASGGVAGIAILLYYVQGIPTGTTNLLLNAVIILIGWHFIEKRTLVFTLYSLVMMSWFMNSVHPPVFISNNILVSSITGGVVMGVGLGLIVRGFGTSAGVDIIALIMKKYIGLSFSLSVFILNILIMMVGSLVIGIENAIVTLIMKYISSYMIDIFTEGFDRRKSMMIISDKHEEVAHHIVERIGRGLTVFKAYGYYSHNEKDVLYVIVTRNQVIQIQRLIATIDPNAFVTITDVQQVIGQGFTFFNPGNKNNKYFA